MTLEVSGPSLENIVTQQASFGCLSVDERVRRLGIPIVSRCNCCVEGHEEDLEHVLGKGDFAQEVWKKVSDEVGVPFLAQQSWRDRIQLWFARSTRNSQVGILLGLIPVVVTWRLWRRRCVARMEGKYESVQQVWYSVLVWVKLFAAETKGKKLSSKDLKILVRLEIQPVQSRPPKIDMVRWLKPNIGRLKLNLDGSSLGNSGPSGGGGVLRNQEGRLVFAFSKFFESCTNNEAELRAVIEGL